MNTLPLLCELHAHTTWSDGSLSPRLELTFEHDDAVRSAHAVAVGLRTLPDVSRGLEHALVATRAAGAALIAAHPYTPEAAEHAPRRTAAFAAQPELRARVDRFELWNRNERFGWVAESGLPPVANGDVHLREHVATRKTMLPCAKSERAIVDYLRSDGRVAVADLTGLSLAA